MVTNRHQQVFSTYIAIISEKIQNHTQNVYQYIYKCHQNTKQIADHGENELCGGGEGRCVKVTVLHTYRQYTCVYMALSSLNKTISYFLIDKHLDNANERNLSKTHFHILLGNNFLMN